MTTHWDALAGYLENGGLKPQRQTRRSRSTDVSAAAFGTAHRAAAPPNAITIDSLDVRRGGRVVLQGISMEVRRGTVTGLLGPSGCGKSTLIRAIMGVQIIDSGTVTVLGEAAGAPALRTKVGYVTQAPALYSDLTVRQNLQYFAGILSAPPCRVDSVLETVDLGHVQSNLAANLSGGQRARVSLATALLGDPDLLVLDEPTVGLDPVLRLALWHTFTELARNGTTLLVSSHVMDEAARCDDLLLLRDGDLLASGSPDALRARTGEDDLETAFLRLAEEAAA